MSNIEPQEVFRKTFSARSIRVTEENLEAVAKWCGGTVMIYRSPDGPKKRIDFAAHGFKGVTNIDRAYVGDWVVFATATSDFKAYRDPQYRSIFETRAERVHRESLMEPELAARNHQVLQLVKRAMTEQDLATYFSKGSEETKGTAEAITEEILKLFI
ncbi:hypothetical protein [Streptomyces phage Psst1]|nr:hypothetical protein [Streptomyces phage Psst1]WPJ30683.1 hypothetical protein [Streptomyces phage Psst2]